MRMLNPMSANWSRRPVSPDLVGEVFEDFDRIVDSFLRPSYVNTVNFQPTCDINETEDHYLVSFDMPGVKTDDIKIEVNGNQLMISGERHRVGKDETADANQRHEKLYARYERTFELPTTIDFDKIEAQHENGVLNVALPKAQPSKGRTIQIQTGQGGFLNKLLGAKKEAAKEVKDIKTS